MPLIPMEKPRPSGWPTSCRRLSSGWRAMKESADRAARLIQGRLGLAYEVGIVLGSGLGGLASSVTDAVRIPYAEIPGFPVSSVSSHTSEVVAGHIEGIPLIVLSGRAHYFESGDA